MFLVSRDEWWTGDRYLSTRGWLMKEVAEHTVVMFFSWLVLEPMMTTDQKYLQYSREHQNWRPLSSGIRWSDKSFFLYNMWIAGCACGSYLGKRWQQDALWEESKPVEPVWCPGKCSAGKPWVLLSMWMLSLRAHAHAYMSMFHDVSWPLFAGYCFRSHTKMAWEWFDLWLCIQIP